VTSPRRSGFDGVGVCGFWLYASSLFASKENARVLLKTFLFDDDKVAGVVVSIGAKLG
jgi:hypothetical protein